MATLALITVTTPLKSDELGPEDANIVGTYGVALGDEPGAYSPAPRDRGLPVDAGADPKIEAALDVFHDHVGISNLDHFEISAVLLPEGVLTDRDDIHWL